MIRRPIREAQEFLRLIAFQYPVITLLNPDGIFGPLTAQAVREFQEAFGLPVTGVIDFETWDSIYRVYLPLRQGGTPVNHLGPRFPLAEGTLKRGDTGLPVELLHVHFNQLGRQFHNLTPVAEKSPFGEVTQRNVLEIQRLGNLEQTGEVNAQTWNVLLGISGMFE